VKTCILTESGGVRLELSSGAALTGDAVLVAAERQSAELRWCQPAHCRFNHSVARNQN
jgi:hypothetical protein